MLDPYPFIRMKHFKCLVILIRIYRLFTDTDPEKRVPFGVNVYYTVHPVYNSFAVKIMSILLFSFYNASCSRTHLLYGPHYIWLKMHSQHNCKKVVNLNSNHSTLWLKIHSQDSCILVLNLYSKCTPHYDWQIILRIVVKSSKFK